MANGEVPRSCYLAGSPVYYELDTGGEAQHNFGAFVALELRP